MNDIILFDLLGLAVVVGIVAFFNWPRRKPEAHGFGDAAFQRTLKTELTNKEIKAFEHDRTVRKEIRRSRLRGRDV